MKKPFFIILAVLCANALYSQNYKIGTSCSPLNIASAAGWGDESRKAGIEYLEVTLNSCFRNVSPEDYETRMKELKIKTDSVGIPVWSMHLPFSRDLDISVTDDAKRAANVELMSRYIRWCAPFKPFKLVLHPSSEPIADGEREQRIVNCIASIDILRKVAAEMGAQLCIENLPRTCLGNTPQELRRIVERYPDVGVCFDTNHYLKGDPEVFVAEFGARIATVHISDYDGVDERHWIPGADAFINWGAMMKALVDSGYRGVFMFEVARNRDGSAFTSAQIVDAYNYIVGEYRLSVE